jgi:hypothetical protein
VAGEVTINFDDQSKELAEEHKGFLDVTSDSCKGLQRPRGVGCNVKAVDDE